MILDKQTAVEFLMPETGKWFSLLAGLYAVVCREYILVAAREPWVAVSSGIIGGGLGSKQYFINRQVEAGYCAGRPEEELAAFLATTFQEYKNSGGSDWTALMTAAHVEDACFIRLARLDCQAAVIVTAGVNNACAAGITPHCTLGSRVNVLGTINIMAFLSHALSNGALVNAVQTVTEAKTQTLCELGVRCPITGAYASGTSTDAVIVAAANTPFCHPYAGPATLMGYLLAFGVRKALPEALKRYRARSKEKN